MNINLSSVSESPKAAKSVASGEEVASDASESGGFFSKLAAMIKGEGKAEGGTESVKSVENEGDSEVSSDGEVSETKVAKTEAQSTDELLAADDGSAQQASTKSEGESESASSAQKTAEQESKSAPSESASKIVSENDEVLQRLNESNNALKPKDGKELPQDVQQVKGESAVDESAKPAAKVLAAEEVEVDVKELKTAEKADVGTDRQPVAAEKSERDTQTVMSADGEEVAVPASVAPFIQQQAPKADQQNESESQTPLSSSAAAAIAVSQADSELAKEIEQVKAQGDAEQVKNIDTDALKAENAPVTQVSPEDVAEPVVAVGMTAAVAASATQTGKAPVQTKASIEDSPKLNQTQTTSPASVDGEMDPNMAAAAPVAAAAAIPWATSTDVPVSDEVAIKHDMAPKAQQAAVAQSVQQALTQQQAQAAHAALQSQSVQQAAAAMPADLAAMQMQQLAAAPNVAINQDQALLKAALGAKAAGSIGQLAKNGESQQPGQESGFAQQLSQAAGAQGTQSLGQARAEQIAAQAPLQLNREMASEQVAERVQMMLSKNLKNIDIRLDPPELGRMQIRMNMNGDAATVHFTVANQQARDVIEQSMPRLREMLAQQGVQLNDSSVQQQAGQQQKGYANAGQGQTGQGNSNQGVSGEENLEADINLDLNVAAKRDGISYYA
ncbi:flagellar hook-length control protein FliK [Vibrio orientalis CIP 102891 = ATCC 33934]|uniref:Flagellar hook-length control protein FliK n=1 Tax=Vibrio orientalis CIP 102891 = ATCC 33934 TaxID=675816 RepID=C9QHM4_VIBOR|nr:flagellar hook-length control protein FliK [Vibrio orientalis]EEX91707.1 flagellar hook-length control protein FliK [Vibrio orientalis CIP 102891 = ATCC 33934]EGU45110.1 flagellar hook-length control protein FliK [Vibrio orientalis CIP 102891 = ATCC 33934]